MKRTLTMLAAAAAMMVGTVPCHAAAPKYHDAQVEALAKHVYAAEDAIATTELPSSEELAYARSVRYETIWCVEYVIVELDGEDHYFAADIDYDCVCNASWGLLCF